MQEKYKDTKQYLNQKWNDNNQNILENHFVELNFENTELIYRVSALIPEYTCKMQNSEANDLQDSNLNQYGDEKRNQKEVPEKEFKQMVKSFTENKKDATDMENLVENESQRVEHIEITPKENLNFAAGQVEDAWNSEDAKEQRQQVADKG